VRSIYLSDLSHVMAAGLTSEFLPYGVGCIKSYFQKHAQSRGQFEIRLFQDPEIFIAAYLAEPAEVVAFSNYSWNRDLSYSLAEEVKRRRPGTLVVFGGPNYPLEDPLREEWLKRFPAVDVYVTGEGEQPFARLIDLWAGSGDVEEVKRAGVEGCHALVEGRLFRSSDVTPRLPSLDVFPSPYAMGYLDEFLDNQKLIPLTETNRGCPFQCTFCEKGVGSWNKLTFGSMARFEDEIRYIAQRTKSSFLILADNNFGMFKQDVEAARAMTKTYREFGYPLQVYSATGKSRYDLVAEAIKALEGRMPVTVAVQSLDSDVLKNIKRKNLPLENLIEVSHGRYSAGQRSRSEVILALPGDTKDKHIHSLCELMDAGVSFLLAYTLILLDGSEMATAESRTKWRTKTKFRINHRCFGSYRFGDSRLRAAEIEEVVVGQDTLTFEDYLECRLFYLTVGVFYMDEILFELIEFLKAHGIKPSQFIRYLHTRGRAFFNERLLDLYRSFGDATRTELWDSREDLLEFMKAADRTEADVRAGKMGGYNVIFWHRAKVLTEMVEDVIDAAFQAATELLPPAVVSDHADYLSQLKTYMVLRKRNVFDFKSVQKERFDFDFLELDKTAFLASPERAAEPIEIEFYHSSEQVALFGTFHGGVTGAARAMAKLCMPRMYRTMRYESSPPARSASARDGREIQSPDRVLQTRDAVSNDGP
jgi:radical SAM superfamily enzyme YgiQ (UPF0313 family)